MAGKNKQSSKSSSSIAVNRKARHDYDILKTIECGLVLTGSEVKSLREGKGNIIEAYGVFSKGEFWLLNSSIAPYSNGGYSNHEDRRTRKLLIHKREMVKLKHEMDTQSLTIVPLKLYWKAGKVKAEMALVRGRKKHDKRAAIKEKDWKRQQQRAVRS
jgi:SsrA-binding protein